MHTNGSTRVVAVCVVISAMVAACSGNTSDDRVLVVGDSITLLVSDELDRDRGEVGNVIVSAANNATSKDMLGVVEQFAGHDFDQVVLNVGTNDALQSQSPDETESTIREMITTFEDAGCIHLTTLNEHVVSFEDPQLVERLRAINERLRAIADSTDNVTVIDWNHAIEANDADRRGGRSLLLDTVHPTSAGQALLASLYREAIEGCEA